MRTVLLLLTVALLLLGPASGQQIYFTLGDDTTRYTTNNVEFLITDIGEDAAGALPSLACHTDLTTCCRGVDGSPGGAGEWRFPDGTLLSNDAGGGDFYFNRNAAQLIRLRRRESVSALSPTGSYCCTVPTMGGDMTLCANLVVCLSLSLANGVVTYDNQGVGGVATHSCDPGYTLNGPSTRTCQSDGTWDGTAPTCEMPPATPCTDLALPANGMTILYDMGTVGDRPENTVATYSCVTGFVVSGDSTRTCMSDGTWSGSNPTCLAGCPDIPPGEMLADGSVEYFAGTASSSGTTNARPVGVRATFTCDTGFFFVWNSGNVNRNCQSDGTWSGSTPRCEIVCPDLTEPANSAIAYSGVSANSADIPTSPDGGAANARPVGIVATYSCPDSQFTLVGSATRTCQMDRSWSGSEPSCQSSCSDLTDTPANGDIMYDMGTSDSRPPGTVATYSCMDNFMITGSLTMRTCNDGSWTSGDAPTCTAIVCADLPQPINGLVDYNGAGSTNNRPVGTTATLSCSPGYGQSSGDTSRVCMSDVTWSGSPLVCVIDCGPLTPPPWGSITVISGSTILGSLVMYSCDSCSDLMPVGVANRICGEDGNWVPDAPTCRVKKCPSPPVPDNGYFSTSSSEFSCDTSLTYHCDPGYLIMGSDARTCQPSGDWSEPIPVCEPINCGEPSAVAHGGVSWSSTAYQGVAHYSCDYGYKRFGSEQLTCDTHGSWIPLPPKCNPVDCGSLAAPANGQVDTSSGTTFTSEAVYSCSVGYNLVGAAVRTCEGDGTWQPVVAPTCEIVDCGPLSHPDNGAVNTDSGTTYNSMALYSCDNGYEINGPSQRTCTATGQWSSSPPTCDAVDCGVLPALQNGNMVLSEGTHFPSVASYSCDPGYNLTGCSTAQCQADGTWSCDPPFCADNVYIQLKFGPTSHCVDWSEKRVELLYTKMRSLILRAIQRYGNNAILPKKNTAPGYFSCFHLTTGATFRTRITGTESVSAVEYAAMIQSWVESGVSSRLQWYIIKIDKNCPVRIESMEEDECQ